MKTILFSILLLPFTLLSQTEGTITIHKPGDPCSICAANTVFQGSKGLTVRLNRKESFRKETINCYKISLYQNGSLLVCFNALPDTVNYIPYITPGKYDVVASADNRALEKKEITIEDNKTSYIVFEFGENENKPKQN
jgi:hypothetical protein